MYGEYEYILQYRTEKNLFYFISSIQSKNSTIVFYMTNYSKPFIIFYAIKKCFALIIDTLYEELCSNLIALKTTERRNIDHSTIRDLCRPIPTLFATIENFIFRRLDIHIKSIWRLDITRSEYYKIHIRRYMYFAVNVFSKIRL